MGDKISAKRAAEESKVPIIDGSDFIIHDVDTAMKIADEIGYPVMLKASNGGGWQRNAVLYKVRRRWKKHLKSHGMNPNEFLERRSFL